MGDSINKKIKRIIIYGTLISLLSSSTQLAISDSRYNDFSKRISNYLEEEDDIIIFAHRGFSSLEVENSKAAIDLCSQYDCIDGIEVDISMTKDNQLVLLHTDANGYNINLTEPIYKLNYSDIKDKWFKPSSIETTTKTFINFNQDIMSNTIINRTYDLVNKKTRIETLDNFFNTFDQDKILLLDIKFNSNCDLMIKKISYQLERVNTDNIIIQSSNYFYLSKMKKQFPQYKYQLIISKLYNLLYLDTDFENFAIKDSLITYNIVKDMINKNKNIMVWTVNDADALSSIMKKVKDYFDDINYITDYPDCIGTILSEKTKKIGK